MNGFPETSNTFSAQGKKVFDLLRNYCSTFSGISVRSLADFLFEVGRNMHLMRMDIEGAEFPIFESTPPEVWDRIDRIVMETHEEAGGRSQGLLVNTLKKQGFYVKIRPMFLYAIRPELSLQNNDR